MVILDRRGLLLFLFNLNILVLNKINLWEWTATKIGQNQPSIIHPINLRQVIIKLMAIKAATRVGHWFMSFGVCNLPIDTQALASYELFRSLLASEVEGDRAIEHVWVQMAIRAYLTDWYPILGAYFCTSIITEANSRVIADAVLVDPICFDRVPLFAL